jgi:hypothetical protein
LQRSSGTSTTTTKSESEIPSTLDVDAATFLLLADGLFFLLETFFHYSSFSEHLANHNASPQALELIVGSLAVSLGYFAFAYFSWKNKTNEQYFGMGLLYSFLLVLLYFMLTIVLAVLPKLYFLADLEYAQFSYGYGSVTIFVEMLTVFFCYRAYMHLRA